MNITGNIKSLELNKNKFSLLLSDPEEIARLKNRLRCYSRHQLPISVPATGGMLVIINYNVIKLAGILDQDSWQNLYVRVIATPKVQIFNNQKILRLHLECVEAIFKTDV